MKNVSDVGRSRHESWGFVGRWLRRSGLTILVKVHQTGNNPDVWDEHWAIFGRLVETATSPT